MSENWLITGGCGFIGRNLIRRLLREADIGIRVFDNGSVCNGSHLAEVCPYVCVQNGMTAPSAGEVQLFTGDITNTGDAIQAVQHMDVIIHLAANTGVPNSVADPVQDFRYNTLGTFTMLNSARSHGVKKFIFASSGAPTGNSEPPITEKAVVAPMSPYGASKLAGEGYCSAWFHCYGLETVALRFSNVYGPYSRHKSSVVAQFINAAMQGKDWIIFGNGEQTRDFLFVEDLVEAIWLAALTPAIGGEIFQISTGVEYSLHELTEKLKQALNACGIKDCSVRNEPIRLGDIQRNFADPSKAEKMLAWKFTTGLSEGLMQTVRWYQKDYMPKSKQI